jgi:predicted flap endonuclease-1-like 5' DNA nuclease
MFETPIEYLKGVGASRAEVLKKELGIFKFEDLLTALSLINILTVPSFIR